MLFREEKEEAKMLALLHSGLHPRMEFIYDALHSDNINGPLVQW
jgi:hypothetical protein